MKHLLSYYHLSIRTILKPFHQCQTVIINMFNHQAIKNWDTALKKRYETTQKFENDSDAPGHSLYLHQISPADSHLLMLKTPLNPHQFPLKSSCKTMKPPKKIPCQEAFDVFDVDGDGQISLSELRVMLSGAMPLGRLQPHCTDGLQA